MTDLVLSIEPENVKALRQRAKAHAKLEQFENARSV